MGDNGQLYASYNEAMCKAMQDLVAHADLIMPNYTEACFLLNHPYGDESLVSHQTLVDMADKRECKIVCVNRYCMNLLYAPYWGKQR